MARKFTWDAWDFDCDGYAYVIAKAECPELENVPDYIITADNLHGDCKDGMKIEEGWCKYQVRTDWENGDGEPLGGYYVSQIKSEAIRPDGKHRPGWFPVWIIRRGDWY
jgi:hypothetical protein